MADYLSQQQNYSSTCDNTCDFFLALIANFYYLTVVIKSVKTKVHGKYLFLKTELGMRFFARIMSCARIILLPTVPVKASAC